jgi:phosphoribosyl 1,2-cyclic phosphodiesterase
MRYINFCSGSKGNCTYIESKEAKIIIDCGHTKKHLSQSLHNFQINLEGIDALLITHDHIDHISSLKLFDSIEKVYSPIELKEKVVKRPSPYHAFYVKDIEVTPLVLSHDSGLTYGYTFRTDDYFLVYITDTGYLNQNNFSYIQNADCYIIESNHDPELLMKSSRPMSTKQRILSDTGHLSNQDAAEILKKVVGPKTKEVLLAHLSLETNTHEVALNTVKTQLQDKNIYIQCAHQHRASIGGLNHEEFSYQITDLSFAHLK